MKFSLKRSALPLIEVLVCWLMVAAGCSRNYDNQVRAMNTANIQRLSNFYASFQSGRFGQGPKNEAEFKQFLLTQSPETFQLMGIDANNKDSIWASERDHKPFKVRYGVDSPLGGLAAVVFEQDGIGGKRQVCFNNSKIEEADEARYKELWEGRGVEKPPPIGAPPPGTSDAGKKK
jgi:hypothetical protein